jgi:hypothetical protein
MEETTITEFQIDQICLEILVLRQTSYEGSAIHMKIDKMVNMRSALLGHMPERGIPHLPLILSSLSNVEEAWDCHFTFDKEKTVSGKDEAVVIRKLNKMIDEEYNNLEAEYTNTIAKITGKKRRNQSEKKMFDTHNQILELEKRLKQAHMEEET